ncbi:MULTISPECIES: ABC transporter transmembrane domain-containing protein [Aerococcus]|uniref:Peptide ABC transporter ATP-binding protein n=1 Tax=Aerococcus sanguinicola TaxID=119206 RepID=A0A5N1GR75_9LACT|nr:MULTISPECIES: ABC transporter transmembrane domain-containing protein [Aerococcus]KAA9301200.1 peptide ABC transporter ATP-binding protein [Aerococcus sanguinicola]MDK6369266.1 ABC transporter transmembrane domain-containing protein [Aerococcus sp. UMB9870]MDK6679090.1 ABC transporter transmembrane domain-containing protein [Aerococcus sp. UMB8608]MDK6686997.1 ABC transporter transmembrane domain-containing protein [Aerococcus sp. UMB8623]MDK6940153.1 ABC transporter transmembrane domain-co
MKKFKWIKQHEQKDCGIACLAMILHHYGSQLPFYRLREMSNSQRDGTSAYGLKTCLESLGFDCLAIEATDEVWTDSEMTYPAIAHVVTESQTLHYVVVYGFDSSELLIADPAHGTYKESIDSFAEKWTNVLLVPKPRADYQEVKEEGSSLRKFIPLLWKSKRSIISITLYSAGIILFSVLTSLYFQVLIDDLIPRHNYRLLALVTLALAVIFLARAAFSWLRQKLLIRFGQNLSKGLLLDYLDHVMKLPLKFFETRQVGDIMSRFLDANRIIDALASISLTLILDILTVVSLSVVLFIYHPLLFSINLMILPFYAWVVYKYYRRFDQAKEEEMASASHLNSEIIQNLSGIETIKALASEESSLKELKIRFNDYMKKSKKAQSLENNQSALKNIIDVCNQVGTLGIGAYFVLQGRLSLGQFISFHALIVYFTEPLKNIINLQLKLQSAQVANERLDEVQLLDEEDQSNEEISLQLREGIIVDQLGFSYSPEEMVLEDISFSIPYG